MNGCVERTKLEHLRLRKRLAISHRTTISNRLNASGNTESIFIFSLDRFRGSQEKTGVLNDRSWVEPLFAALHELALHRSRQSNDRPK